MSTATVASEYSDWAEAFAGRLAYLLGLVRDCPVLLDHSTGWGFPAQVRALRTKILGDPDSGENLSLHLLMSEMSRVYPGEWLRISAVLRQLEAAGLIDLEGQGPHGYIGVVLTQEGRELSRRLRETDVRWGVARDGLAAGGEDGDASDVVALLTRQTVGQLPRSLDPEVFGLPKPEPSLAIEPRPGFWRRLWRVLVGC